MLTLGTAKGQPQTAAADLHYDGGVPPRPPKLAEALRYGSGGESLPNPDSFTRFNCHVISIDDARLFTDDEEFRGQPMEDISQGRRNES